MTRRTPLERIMAKVTEAAGPLAEPCWVTSAADNGHGYAVMTYLGGTAYVHRLSYQLHVGPIPEGMQIDHLCRNTRCVNPAHLEPVTAKENMARSETVGGRAVRTGTCKRGHSLDDAYILPKGRKCRTCQRLYQAGELDDVARRSPRHPTPKGR